MITSQAPRDRPDAVFRNDAGKEEDSGELGASHPEFAEALRNPLPVPNIEPKDVTEAMVYLCGQSGGYVTGVTLPVDAGLTVK